METITLEWLGFDNSKFLKQIMIVSDRNSNEIEIGSIFYTRPFTESYNLSKQLEEDNATAVSIDRFLRGHPKQKNFPSNDLDDIILNAVKTQFPKSVVKNSLLVFNVDLEKLKLSKARNTVSCTILFTPAFSNMTDLGKYVGRKFPGTRYTFKIYTYHDKNIMPDQLFYADYPFNDKEISEKLIGLIFE